MSFTHSMDHTYCQQCGTMGCQVVLYKNTIKELESEVQRLKGELEKEKYRADSNFQSYERVKENASVLQKDRDLWKAKAERILIELKEAQDTIHNEFCGHAKHHNCCQSVLDKIVEFDGEAGVK